MQIHYAGNPITTADSRQWPPPVSFEWPTEWAVQAQPGLRSTHRKLFPRHNRLDRIAFTIAYQGLSVADALLKILEFKNNLPRQGTLEIIPSAGGGAVSQITFQKATLVRCDGRHTGATAFIFFEFLTEGVE